VRTRTVKDVDCKGRRVLIRVDFNVPLAEDGSVLDDRRISAALPTIQHVIAHGGIAILMSHFGRPAGTGPEPSCSLRPVAARLRELVGSGQNVNFVEGSCVGEAASAAIAGAQAGDIVLLDNLRFEAGEKSNDAAFGAALATGVDAYVNDAFGTAHRAHASMVAVPHAMAGAPCAAGLLLEKEIHFLSDVLHNPTRPFVAVLGGAKVSDKLAAIENLLPKVDTVLVGGAMAYTFLHAQGGAIGESLLERGMVEVADRLLKEAAASDVELLLPTDHLCGTGIEAGGEVRTCELGVPPGWMGLDIGPETVERWSSVLHKAKTIVWNGPVGVFETPPFDTGTMALARAAAEATKKHKAVTVVGGGETAAAVERAGLADAISHVSTGGGASLRMLEGAELPGLASLDRV
jgi:phosphoglycerate kinase